MGRTEGKKPLGRPRPRRKNNIKMEVGWSIIWIDLDQNKDRWGLL